MLTILCDKWDALFVGATQAPIAAAEVRAQRRRHVAPDRTEHPP